MRPLGTSVCADFCRLLAARAVVWESGRQGEEESQCLIGESAVKTNVQGCGCDVSQGRSKVGGSSDQRRVIAFYSFLSLSRKHER